MIIIKHVMFKKVEVADTQDKIKGNYCSVYKMWLWKSNGVKMETKMNKLGKHSFAQVLGYLIGVKAVSPPIGMII